MRSYATKMLSKEGNVGRLFGALHQRYMELSKVRRELLADLRDLRPNIRIRNPSVEYPRNEPHHHPAFEGILCARRDPRFGH